jgi:hypothetical protein
VNASSTRSGLDSNRSHHAAIDVLHYMTMKRKRADYSWIAKIHPQNQARIFTKPVPCGQVNCVARGGFFPTHGSAADYDEM